MLILLILKYDSKMKLNELTKYVSLNILSLLGYICFFITLYTFVFALPQANNLDSINNDWNGLKHTYDDVLIPYFYYSIIHLSVSLFLVIGAIIEYVLYKKGIIKRIQFLDVTDKLKSVLFWIGILFVPISVYLVVIFYIFLKIYGI